MAISPVLFNGSLGMSQGVASIRANEQNRPELMQVVTEQKHEQEVQTRLSRVRNADNTENHTGTMDSKEKGSNEYFGDGGRHRKKNDDDGTVLIKGKGGFDISV